ncbi:MAG: metal ABC transporter substrate-binding protein [Bacilli bacterium]
MKKLLLIPVILLFLTGCEGLTNDFKDEYTTTTLYPIEYATNQIYGKGANIRSIYPNDINTDKYSLTTKQKKNYAQSKTFIYGGIAKENDLAKDLLNLNNNLQIIDAMKGMSITTSIEELWLDPSNFLMICRNIKEGLIDYSENVYTQKEIEKQYDKLKEKISELDVDFYNLGKNGNYKSLLVSNDLFNYLNKYGIETISLNNKSSNIDKAYSSAKKLIDNKSVKYVYAVQNEVLDDKLSEFISKNNLEIIEIKTLKNISNADSKDNEDYISLIKEIINEYKKELYK